MELFKRVAGVEIAPVPDRGGLEAILDLLRGRVHLMVHNLPTAIVGVREREVRRSRSRARAQPGHAGGAGPVRVLSGVRGHLLGRSGRPGGSAAPGLVQRLSRLTRGALDSPDLAKIVQGHGAAPWWTTRKTSQTSARGRRRCSPGGSWLRPRESISRPIAGPDPLGTAMHSRRPARRACRRAAPSSRPLQGDRDELPDHLACRGKPLRVTTAEGHAAFHARK